MSLEALTWAFRQDLPTGEKFTLVAICDYVDHNGEWHIKYSTLARKTSQARETIMRQVERLKARGLLETRETRSASGRQGANLFRVLMTPVTIGDGAESGDDPLPSSRRKARSRVTQDHPGQGDSERRQGDSEPDSRVTQSHPYLPSSLPPLPGGPGAARDGDAAPGPPVDPALAEAGNPELAEDWRAVKAMLGRALSGGEMRSWIEKLAPVALTPDPSPAGSPGQAGEGATVELRAPSDFVADRVRALYGDRLRAAWAARTPGVERVTITAERVRNRAAPVPAQAGSGE